MAIGALCEGNACESRLAAGCCRSVTLRARNLGMQAGERKLCLGVIEMGGCLPVHEVMALQAALPQLPVVNIFVARHTILRQAQEGLVQVLHLDQRFFGRLDVRSGVTFAAFDSRVFSLQDVPGLGVVEFL